MQGPCKQNKLNRFIYIWTFPSSVMIFHLLTSAVVCTFGTATNDSTMTVIITPYFFDLHLNQQLQIKTSCGNSHFKLTPQLKLTLFTIPNCPSMSNVSIKLPQSHEQYDCDLLHFVPSPYDPTSQLDIALPSEYSLQDCGKVFRMAMDYRLPETYLQLLSNQHCCDHQSDLGIQCRDDGLITAIDWHLLNTTGQLNQNVFQQLYYLTSFLPPVQITN
eukprot:NODE_395_length_8134_cov_0.767393.p6 type:complete len:217 gc:universal NODE_395_length_8134_cov_0.767393:664-1314(+)